MPMDLRQLLKASEDLSLDLLVVRCLSTLMDFALNHGDNVCLAQCGVIQGYANELQGKLGTRSRTAPLMWHSYISSRYESTYSSVSLVTLLSCPKRS